MDNSQEEESIGARIKNLRRNIRPITHFYEEFLTVHQGRRRNRRIPHGRLRGHNREENQRVDFLQELAVLRNEIGNISRRGRNTCEENQNAGVLQELAFLRGEIKNISRRGRDFPEENQNVQVLQELAALRNEIEDISRRGPNIREENQNAEVLQELAAVKNEFGNVCRRLEFPMPHLIIDLIKEEADDGAFFLLLLKN